MNISNPKTILLFSMMAFICAAISPLGEKESMKNDRNAAKEYSMKITGILRLVGNEPFTRLVVTTREGIDYIIGDASEARRKMHDLQGKELVVEGLVKESDVFAGKDKYLGKEFVIYPSSYYSPPQR